MSLTYNVAKKLLDQVNGSSFVGIDTETVVSLTGGKGNPHQGRITKRTSGSSVMVFQNKAINGYEAMVQRRLEKEGKDPESFQLQPRMWGTRLPDQPFIEPGGQYYLEVIFLRAGETEYLLDGKPIAKGDIQGLKPSREGGQGGLSNKVVIRTFKLSSIRAIRIDGTEYTF